MSELNLNSILEKVDCRYTLVVEVAKRARQLVDGSEPLTEKTDPNPVSQAANEVDTEKIGYIRQ